MARSAIDVSNAGGFRVAAVWALTGNLVYAACQWGALVVLARTGGPLLVGEFSFALAITGPVFMLTNLQLANLLVTDAAQHYPFATYQRLRWQSALTGMMACGLIGLLMGLRDAILLGLLTLAAAKAVETLSDLYYGLMQRADAMRAVAISQAIRGFGMLVALGTGVLLTGRLLAGVALMGVVWLLCLTGYDRVVAKRIEPVEGAVRAGDVRTLLLAGLPLGLSAMLIALNVNFPRIVVERYLGHSALGVYSVMAYFVLGGRMAIVPLVQVATPRFGRLRAAGDRHGFQRLLVKLGFVLGVIGLVGILGAVGLGDWLLRVLFGAEFAVESRALTILMIAAAMGYLSTLFQFVAVAQRRLGAQAAITVCTLLLTAIGCIYAVPRYGLIGAAWAVVLSSVVELTGSAMLVRDPPPLPPSPAT